MTVGGPVLDYRDPAEDRRKHSAAVALVLCAPGLACWILYLLLFLGDVFVPIPFGGMMILWGLAVVTAIVSLLLYLWRWRWRKSWHVWLNLTINVSGLAFTAWLLPRILGASGTGLAGDGDWDSDGRWARAIARTHNSLSHHL